MASTTSKKKTETQAAFAEQWKKKKAKNRYITVILTKEELPKISARANQHRTIGAWIRSELGLPELKIGRPRKAE